MHLQPQVVVRRVSSSGDTLKCGVLSGVHLHVPKTQEMRGLICSKGASGGKWSVSLLTDSGLHVNAEATEAEAVIYMDVMKNTQYTREDI